MLHDVAVNIGIQLTFMLLIYGREAAMSAEDDMIDKMGITHDGTKVHRMPQLHKTCRAVGSPPATFTCMAIPVVMPTPSLRSFAGITTGYSDGRPPGVNLAHSWFHAGYLDDTPPGVNLGYSCFHAGYQDGRPSGFVDKKGERFLQSGNTLHFQNTHTIKSYLHHYYSLYFIRLIILQITKKQKIP